jgi:hypothetical protein
MRACRFAQVALALVVLMVAAILAPRTVLAADPLPAIAARLADAPVVRGRFEQTRRLAGFSKPLVSRGDFLVARSRGLVWQVREPVPSSLVVTPARLALRGADGSLQREVRTDSQPGMQAVAQAMLAVLNGDVAALSERFTVDARLEGRGGWALTLVPRDAGMRRAFARIEIAGDRFVRQLRLEEESGDSTAIRLLDPTALQTLSRDEEQRFD